MPATRHPAARGGAIVPPATVRFLPDRSALETDLVPPAPAADRLRRELDRAEQRFVARVAGAGGIAAWRADMAGAFAAARPAPPASRARSAGLVVALLDGVVRDRCWLAVEQGDPVDLPGWTDLWRHLARHALRPYRAEPLFLLAWTLWRSGDRVTAGLVTAMVGREDPTHRAGGMLAEVVRLRLDPARVSPLCGRRPTVRPTVPVPPARATRIGRR